MTADSGNMSFMPRARKIREPIPGYITVADAARIVGVSDSRIRQLIRAGDLIPLALGPRYQLVKRSDADAIKRNPATIGRPRGSGNKAAAST